ncbi:hypothetical protein AGDE_15516 [Angomonas deanei]|nr:hypothetical protein AGDE_15516 [Angomonas deanei]|eukprot:EPY18936.1 hypothetical protein AGDE_15516 [Angomonas deanei]
MDGRRVRVRINLEVLVRASGLPAREILPPLLRERSKLAMRDTLGETREERHRNQPKKVSRRRFISYICCIISGVGLVAEVSRNCLHVSFTGTSSFSIRRWSVYWSHNK